MEFIQITPHIPAPIDDKNVSSEFDWLLETPCVESIKGLRPNQHRLISILRGTDIACCLEYTYNNNCFKVSFYPPVFNDSLSEKMRFLEECSDIIYSLWESIEHENLDIHLTMYMENSRYPTLLGNFYFVP